jgi:hypothetical protein
MVRNQVVWHLETVDFDLWGYKSIISKKLASISSNIPAYLISGILNLKILDQIAHVVFQHSYTLGIGHQIKISAEDLWQVILG